MVAEWKHYPQATKDRENSGMELALTTPKIEAWIDDGVGWLVFNQPERRNAISAEMWTAIAQALDAMGRDDAVRVIVMRGAGEKAFASGGDISEYEDNLAGVSAARDARARYQKSVDAGLSALSAVEKPLIAMVHGYCFGGGILIALQADLRIASDEARFSIPAARIGIGYPYEHVARLAQLVGPAVASDLLFTARTFGSTEAKAMGLANQVVPTAELEPTVRGIARQIADNAPLTIRAAKIAIRASMQDSVDRDAPRVETLVNACMESEDFLVGTRAFMDKRKPCFTGR